VVELVVLPVVHKYENGGTAPRPVTDAIALPLLEVQEVGVAVAVTGTGSGSPTVTVEVVAQLFLSVTTTVCTPAHRKEADWVTSPDGDHR
jgi:hypothetical protein